MRHRQSVGFLDHHLMGYIGLVKRWDAFSNPISNISCGFKLSQSCMNITVLPSPSFHEIITSFDKIECQKSFIYTLSIIRIKKLSILQYVFNHIYLHIITFSVVARKVCVGFNSLNYQTLSAIFPFSKKQMNNGR